MVVVVCVCGGGGSQELKNNLVLADTGLWRDPPVWHSKLSQVRT